jgi:hypothetical protein
MACLHDSKMKKRRIEKGFVRLSHEALSESFGRLGGIRTRDPLHPMQVRYQAALQAEKYVKTQEKDGAAGRN